MKPSEAIREGAKYIVPDRSVGEVAYLKAIDIEGQPDFCGCGIGAALVGYLGLDEAVKGWTTGQTDVRLRLAIFERGSTDADETIDRERAGDLVQLIEHLYEGHRDDDEWASFDDLAAELAQRGL